MRWDQAFVAGNRKAFDPIIPGRSRAGETRGGGGGIQSWLVALNFVISQALHHFRASLSLSLSPLEKAEEGMQVASVCSFDEELPITGTWLSYVRTCLRPNGSLSTAGGRPLFPERRQRLLGLGCPPNKLSPPSLPCVEYVTMLWHRSEKLAPGTARNGVFHYYYY